MKITYDLKEVKDKRFFCEMLSYVSEYIQNIEIMEDYETVEIYCNESQEKEVMEKIDFLKDMVTKRLTEKEDTLSIKTLEDYSVRPTLYDEDVFQQMMDEKLVYPLADGAYAYGGIYLKIFEYFSKKIEDFGLSQYKAYRIQKQKVPALYSLEGYEEGGYFETFPHHIMFQSVLKNDIQVLDKFSKEGICSGRIFDEMKQPDNVLRTATCAPIYKFLQNSIIENGVPKTFLVSGTCFRNEANNVKALSRLKEFYMKEYVFVGSADEIGRCMEAAKEIWKYWIDTFQLNCKIETANDSFFANNYKKLKLFQLLGQSKQEFKLLIPSDGEYISCGSANFHRTHFTKRYCIYDENKEKLANSACFAFGVDRLTYAFLSQKGMKPEEWDEKTRCEVQKYVEL